MDRKNTKQKTDQELDVEKRTSSPGYMILVSALAFFVIFEHKEISRLIFSGKWMTALLCPLGAMLLLMVYHAVTTVAINALLSKSVLYEKLNKWRGVLVFLLVYLVAAAVFYLLHVSGINIPLPNEY